MRLSVFKLDFKYPIKIINRLMIALPISWSTKAIFCKHYVNFIYSKLVPLFNKAINSVAFKKDSQLSHHNSQIIWVFWWQGKLNMPLIVKKCYQSIVKHANGHKVILITKNNITKYSNMPQYIYTRLYDHDMTLTHFSDVLRFNLLKNYGGLWLDSTMYCSSDINDNCFTNIYTSGGYPLNQTHNFTCKWTEFLIGGLSHSPIFEFINEFFNLYWQNHYRSIDYFQADYALRFLYLNNISHFKDYVDIDAPRNNPHLYYLLSNLNNAYNGRKYKAFMKDTNLFKLTYKKKFVRINHSDKTFYNELLNDKLD